MTTWRLLADRPGPSGRPPRGGRHQHGGDLGARRGTGGPPGDGGGLRAAGRRAGRAAVGGISTEVIWEHDEAGDAPEELAEDFGLTTDRVRRALAFETSLGAA